jgi:tetratricopeptide (TPR) repeat protein
VHRAATRLLASFPNQLAPPSLATWAEKALGYYALATHRVWLETHVPHSSSSSPATAPTTPDGSEEPQLEGEVPVGVAIGKTIVDESTLASAFRSFHQFVTAAAGTRLTPEIEGWRREVYRCYFKFLSLLLLPRNHPSRLINTATGAIRITNSSKVGSTEQLQGELKAISTVYEGYLLSSLKFPMADEYYEVVGEWVDQVVENWRVSGGSVEDAAPVVEILYRASRKTFHSPRILRHLFYTLTATGNFQDALAALNTYLDLVQKALDRISKGNEEKDFDTQKIIVQTAVEGIRVLCKFGVNGQKPMDIAARMEKWVEAWRLRDKDILAEAYRGIGMANAAFARQTPEGELRPGAQQAAADAFRKGLTYDPLDIQGWYGLALVEAEMRAVDNATESARKGLGALKYHFLDNEDPEDVEGNARDYKRFAVPLLHLLALLMTTSEDFENAEKVCKNAFDIIGEGREAVADLGTTDKVAIFELMMTQLAIVEAVEEAETATSMAEQLLALYGMLFDGTHLVQRMHEGESQDNDGDVSPSRPTTTMSRRSRLFGKHKKQFSQSHTNLSRHAEDTNSPPSQGLGGTLRRPKSGHKSLVGVSGGATPKIQVIDAQGSSALAPPSDKSQRKLVRPSSVSGSTIKRMRSLSSLRVKGEPRMDEPPTPPLPSSTEASSLNFDIATVSMNGKDPHLFHTLKNKLQHHHLMHASASAGGSVTSIPETAHQINGAFDSTGKRGSVSADAVPHNLPQHKLPYPLGALGRTISDDGLSKTIRRPIQLPEPKLAVEEEQKKVLGVLRKAWICVAGLYRRAGYFVDALAATDEASGLIGNDGEGEADVLTEVCFRALCPRNLMSYNVTAGIPCNGSRKKCTCRRVVRASDLH